MLSAVRRFPDPPAVSRVCLGVLSTVVLLASVAAPQSAQAHGTVDPVASSYLARIKTVPAGMRASVVDGDLRLQLQVPRHESVMVLDYQGAPYVRFAVGRVWANENSEMYYFNQTPPATPPLGLKRTTPEHWVQVARGTSYQWHDGRLHAFALQALAPGAAYAGPWRIPLRVDGRREAITGTLWYRAGPSLVWLWPAVILVLCVLAAWRLHELQVDALLARALAGLMLLGFAVGVVGRNLHGRPGVSLVGVVELVLIAVPTVWNLWRVLRGRAGPLTYLLVSIVGIWETISLIPTLFNGYVLMAVPAFVGRLATILCLGGAIALVFPAVRLFGIEHGRDRIELPDEEAAEAIA